MSATSLDLIRNVVRELHAYFSPNGGEQQAADIRTECRRFLNATDPDFDVKEDSQVERDIARVMRENQRLNHLLHERDEIIAKKNAEIERLRGALGDSNDRVSELREAHAILKKTDQEQQSLISGLRNRVATAVKELES